MIAILLPLPAFAQTTYVAYLRGANEVPANGSSASGTATLILSADETSATLTLNYSGLSAAASAAHVHGPSDPGVAASVIKDIPRDPFSGFVWTFAPVGNLTVADQLTALKAGRLYINVHSSNFPAGEIRGQFYPASAKGNAAQIISVSVPTQMQSGNSYLATVVMKNTGSTTWTNDDLYRLGSQDPQDNDVFGIHRVDLPSGTQIAPGQTATFAYSVFAPFPGTYRFQWRMVQDLVEWFGDFTPPTTITVTSPGPPATNGTNTATFVRQSVPAIMQSGHRYPATVTMRNTGTSSWSSSNLYRLGSQNPQDNSIWGLHRVALPNQVQSVAPGQEVTFTFDVFAPVPGTYAFQWQMVQDLVQWFGDPAPKINVIVTSTPPPAPIAEPDAIRFLEQASFGPNKTEIARVRELGFDTYLNEQFAMPISNYDGVRVTFNASNVFNIDDYVGLRERFFQNALTGPDQLRQRVAFALSQILVVSGVDLSNGKVAALLGYQKVLSENAFGNYRDILYQITLNPAMGRYLNMANNVKATSATGSQPNENFARELLQLFSIGVFQLELDGSLKLDGNGAPLPTYGNAEITNFARVFTGWTYANANGSAPTGGRNGNPFYGTMDTTSGGTLTLYTPLVADPRALTSNNHDTNAKTLLNGFVVTGGKPAAQDLNIAIDNVFNHPNVAPFVCKQLIQHLVTSNPSPGYVRRVASVFNDNGQGVRGDMKAVVRAILLDNEARGDAKTDPSYGHLRAPALYVTNLMRAVNSVGSGTIPFTGVPTFSANLGQNIMTSPTVFNFYLPDYRVNFAGGSVFAPEVQTLTTETAVRRINYANSLIYGTVTGVTTDISEFQALAANPTTLVDALNARLMHGTMSQAMKDKVRTAVAGIAVSTTPTATQLRDRARMGLYLVLSSIQYQVQQ